MTDMEKSAAARLPGAHVYLELGEGLASAAGSAVRGIIRLSRRVASAFEAAQGRSAARRALYQLDDRLLNDIGLRRDQVAETVDSMFRAGYVEAAGASEAAAETNAGSGRIYQSAV